MRTEKNTAILFRIFYLTIVLAAAASLLLGLTNCTDSTSESHAEQTPEIELNSFGFYSDSLEHQQYSVEKNETLSDILINLGIGGNELVNIVNRAREVIDVRKIVAGNLYHAYTNDDSVNTLVYFVYEKSPRHFVVFDLKDSVIIYESEKEVVIKENQKSAIIDHSLYVSLIEADASPELAIKLSQIFAWQIDFYHIQKGDNFKIIYEELYVDDKFFAIGQIKAAYFQQNGKDFYAIPFMQDSIFQYFDQDGNSLRKAFLKAPLEFGRISSRYSSSRLHPVLKTRRPHLGVDYAAPTGTPIRTTGDGVISDVGYNGGAGKYIKIKHNSVYSTMYLHMSKYAKGMKKGVRVSQGQVIGYVGSTGLATGPHVDYRFFINGSPVDPLKVELPPSQSIKKDLRTAYETEKDSLVNRLSMIDLMTAEKPV